MDTIHRNALTKESDLNKAMLIFKQHWKLFAVALVIILTAVFFLNRYMIPKYAISASMLIKEDNSGGSSNMNDFLNSSLFGKNQNFQNELWVLKSTPVISQTVYNLNLTTNYYRNEDFRYLDAYEYAPFKVYIRYNHIQPLKVKFQFIPTGDSTFTIKGESKSIWLYDYENHSVAGVKDDWSFTHTGKAGKLIETPDLSFIISFREDASLNTDDNYYFEFISDRAVTENLKSQLNYTVIDQEATVVKIEIKSESPEKGKDIVNEVMNVYSQQSLDRKNHTAENTIRYIESQLNEISEVLSNTEDTLQRFRASNQILNVAEQATGISQQYMDLQNQLAEMVTRKRYYDYVNDYLSKNEDFSNIIVPASMGIPDQMLNNLMSELVGAYAQRARLIDNKQEKNPLVNRLTIQIENLRKTITENISEVQKTTDISMEEMQKRIGKIEAQIRTMPMRERQLGGIERKYRLSDAIYNYLLEKRAEAQITKASNLPNSIIIEPAEISGQGPVSPNTRLNYFAGLFLGIVLPFALVIIRNMMNNKITSVSDIESVTDFPVIGTIIHNPRKSDNLVFTNPSSEIAESYRSLRTNIEFKLRNKKGKVLMITSTVEDEGKSFTALNLAMSYAQLNYRTILIDCDLRKVSSLFDVKSDNESGLSSWYNGLEDIDTLIRKTPYPNLDYIRSGPIPPNPVELLSLYKTRELMDLVREHYDCIILDSTPLAQVSDAYQLVGYADLSLLVVRHDHTIKQLMAMVVRDFRNKGIEQVCIIYNDIREYAGQYGYRYGYAKKKAKGLKGLLDRFGH